MRTRLHWVAFALLVALVAGLPCSAAARHYEIDRPTGFDGDPTGGLLQIDGPTGGGTGSPPPPPGYINDSDKPTPVQCSTTSSMFWLELKWLFASLPCHVIGLAKLFTVVEQ
jgi:hypothetical protein